MKSAARPIPSGAARALYRAFLVIRRPVQPIPRPIRRRLFGFTGRVVRRLRLAMFKPKEDDVFIVSFPRSGTTWTQMMLFQLTTAGEGAPADLHRFSPRVDEIWMPAWPFDGLPSPRVFKSHAYYGQIPRWPGRTIYVLRDGRDTAVSLYNLRCSYYGCRETFTEFFDDIFMPGRMKPGGWARHIEGWCIPREGEKILLLRYEEMQRDLGATLRRIAEYCNIQLTPAQMARVEQRCGFDFMKQHEADLNPYREGDRSSFIRKGKSGGWKAHLTPEQNAWFEEECRRRLTPLGITF